MKLLQEKRKEYAVMPMKEYEEMINYKEDFEDVL